MRERWSLSPVCPNNRPHPVRYHFRVRTATLPALLVLFVLQARPANNFALTVDNIMRGPALVGYEPTGVRWSYDGSRLLFQWKQCTDKEIAPMDTYTVNRDGTGLRKLTDAEVRQLPPASGDTTKDQRLTVYSSAGDLYTLDNNTGKITQLTKTTDAETNPHFTQDGKRLCFTRNGNLYVMSLDNGLLVQLTDIRSAGGPATSAAPAGGGRGFGGFGGGRGGPWRTRPLPTAATPEPRSTDSQEYLKKEQKELLQVVRERIEQRDEQKKRTDAQPRANPSPCRHARPPAHCSSRPTKSTSSPASSNQPPRPPKTRSFPTTSPIARTPRISLAARMSATRRALRASPSSTSKAAR